jgi:hypothetical protein
MRVLFCEEVFVAATNPSRVISSAARLRNPYSWASSTAWSKQL